MQKFGLGTYRISDRNPEHIEAIKMAVASGVGIIDTSTNYMDGGAERAIAKALRFLDDDARESVEIVSKFGYIQGSTLTRLKGGETFDEVVEYAPHVFHCIHPDFMRDQLGQSLQRLQRSSLGCYLIHNPEYYLLDALNRQQDRLTALDTMNDRIYRVFVALEKEVQAGRIDSYGVSSNSFSKPADDAEFLPYSDLPALAEHAAETAGNRRHSLTTVQLPINLLEHEGLACAAWAKAHGLRVLANRPLNAQYKRQMYRLAEYPFPAEYDGRLNETLMLCESGPLEPLRTMIMQLDEVKHRFRWAGDYESFLYGEVIPHINRVLGALETDVRQVLAEQLMLFLDAYEKTVAYECGLKTRGELKAFLGGCDAPLQRCALEFLTGRAEIDCILVGMRKPRYVAEVMQG